MGLLLFVGVGLKNGFSGFGRVFLHRFLDKILATARSTARSTAPGGHSNGGGLALDGGGALPSLNLASEHTHSSVQGKQ